MEEITLGGMFSDIRRDFKLYLKSRTSIKGKIGTFFYALLEPGFWAVFFYRISRYLYKKGIWFLPLLLMRLNKFLTGVDISFECHIGSRLRLPHCSDIVIGATATIGNDVEILNGVTLGAKDIRGEGLRHPTVRDGVLIGAGAKILGNITIGRNAKIGANSVVLEDVPENCVAAGIPAKILHKSDDS